MPLEVVCNNHYPAPIYGGYLPWTDVYCNACCAPGAVSACCTCHVCSYMYVYCGAWSTPGAVSACCTLAYVVSVCVCVDSDNVSILCKS